jgi:hypothetical protein
MRGRMLRASLRRLMSEVSHLSSPPCQEPNFDSTVNNSGDASDRGSAGVPVLAFRPTPGMQPARFTEEK